MAKSRKGPKGAGVSKTLGGRPGKAQRNAAIKRDASRQTKPGVTKI
jgi:hypothetical protein